jgi:DNA repair exonuclease SbcCD ATPase subunit
MSTTLFETNSNTAAASSVMFGFDSPPDVRVTPMDKGEADRLIFEAEEECTLTNKNKIKSLQRENAKLKNDNAWLTEHCTDIQALVHSQARVVELKDKRNVELQQQLNQLQQQLNQLQQQLNQLQYGGMQKPDDYVSWPVENDPYIGWSSDVVNASGPTYEMPNVDSVCGPTEQVDLPLEEQNWDDWALVIQSNMSANKMLTDVQQAILKNLAETMTGVKRRLEALEANERKDEAAFCLQSVAKDYLTNKRETAEWVVPEIGTG